jgi:hypothetical protein
MNLFKDRQLGGAKRNRISINNDLLQSFYFLKLHTDLGSSRKQESIGKPRNRKDHSVIAFNDF